MSCLYLTYFAPLFVCRQCSDCAKSSSEESEDSTNVNVNAPRRLRDKINQPARLTRAQEDMEFLFPVSDWFEKNIT